ncbi:FAD-dependent thymidylate synthase [Candidatus Pacearchaeota archaeon]|nr:FAD-dependent thymidylate synthase [Candidatus Pacearchaeota archaeon]
MEKQVKFTLRGETNSFIEKKEWMRFSQSNARVCYSEKDWEELMFEGLDERLIDRIKNSGHHSVCEHINFTLYFSKIPKILAMFLNNEKQYATSEKSARYTVMKDIEPKQKEKYDKWMNVFREEISKKYPESEFPKLYIKDGSGKNPVEKLSQENARYMTSVFTPTKMSHTINLRQINFLRGEFEKFVDEYSNGKNEFKKRLCASMKDFLEETERFDIPNLRNQTDRHLSLLNPRIVEEHFGDVYSTQYNMSFAGLAQAQRHRTINYHISNDIKKGGNPYGFFIPKIISQNPRLLLDWDKDLEEISKEDYPQAQLVRVNERGTIENFRSKCLLRICGAAQNEIMNNTKEIAEKYSQYKKEYKNSLSPKCKQGMKCPSPCVWGEKALERLV